MKELNKRFDYKEVYGNDLSGYDEDMDEEQLDSTDGDIDE